MTTETLHPLAAEYLARLRHAGRGLPPGRRRELLAEIEAHLSEAIDSDATDAQALTVLDRLGEPEAIIAVEASDPDELPGRRGTEEWTAIGLLLLGGFIVGVGWLAGLFLLWRSRAWTKREKWVGTLVFPGGLVTSVIAGLITLIALGIPAKRLCRTFGGGVPTLAGGLPLGGGTHCTPVGGPGIATSILGAVVFAVLVLAPIATSVFLARRAA